MAHVFYVAHDGTEYAVDVVDGLSLMEGAVSNGVPGIDANCGGACACATCAVQVPTGWYERLPAMEAIEAGMLELGGRAEAGWRLACQVIATPALDGLRIHIPSNQN